MTIGCRTDRAIGSFGVVALLALAGCTSGSGGDFASLDAAVTEAEAILDRMAGADLDTLPILPAGRADYAGILSIVSLTPGSEFATDSLGAIGRLSLAADFGGASQVTGTARHFIDGQNRHMAGQLDFTSDFLAGTNFAGQVSGSLIRSDGGEFNVAGFLVDGNFFGADGEFVAAYGENSGEAAGVATPFAITMLAEQ